MRARLLVRPKTKTEALQFLADHGSTTKVIAGGTDLMVQLRKKKPELASVTTLLDLSLLLGLDTIQEEPQQVSIGALVTYQKLSWYPLPILQKAASLMGSPQIRNRGTIGGNLANACPAADCVYPLLALNAEVLVEHKDYTKLVPIQDFITGPYKTSLLPTELITKIVFRRLDPRFRGSFIRLARRESAAIARMQVAVLALKEDVVKDIRIAPGSVFPSPLRVKKAEALLLHEKPSLERIERAAAIVAEEMVALSGRRWSTPYKEPVVIGLTIEALKEALEVQ